MSRVERIMNGGTMLQSVIRLTVILAIVLFQAEAMAQCESDSDCKGNRICLDGACASKSQPGEVTPQVTPAPVSTPDPCAGITCSGHGACAVVSGGAQCQCEEGFEKDVTGTNCNAVPAPVVAPVVAPAAAATTPTPAVQPVPAQPVAAQPVAAQPVAAAPENPPAQEVTVPEPEVKTEPAVSPATNETRKKRLRAGHGLFWPGLALVGFGGISTGVAYSAAQEYNQTFRDDDESRARAWTGMMWTGYGLGLGLMLTGIIVWASAPDADTGPVALAPFASDREFGLSFSGRW